MNDDTSADRLPFVVFVRPLEGGDRSGLRERLGRTREDELANRSRVLAITRDRLNASHDDHRDQLRKAHVVFYVSAATSRRLPRRWHRRGRKAFPGRVYRRDNRRRHDRHDEELVYAWRGVQRSTLLGLCAFSPAFLATYSDGVLASLTRVPLDPAAGERGPSEVLFRSTRTEGAFAQVALEAIAGQPEVIAAQSGWEGMVLVKTTGSSFATFARDDYTTLPDLVDRPLTIKMSVYVRYTDLKNGVAEGPGFLGPRAVRDEVERVFHEFNSRSIQHLVHEMGTRMLEAHRQLQEIEFVAENHNLITCDGAAV